MTWHPTDALEQSESSSPPRKNQRGRPITQPGTTWPTPTAVLIRFQPQRAL
nr:DUF1589 domain-containing protein [Rhodopirellula baltica]